VILRRFGIVFAHAAGPTCIPPWILQRCAFGRRSQGRSAGVVRAAAVTMNSEVAVRDMDSNEEMTFAVVFPSDADVNRQRISILAPMGTAVLGYRVGDTIEWKVPGRRRRLKIERVLFQPEAAGQFDR